jgi:nucleoid-associated protein YgaU
VRETEKFFLVLLIAVTIAIHPAFAQESGAGIKTLDLGMASDDELTQALDKADEIELINKEDNLPAADVPAGAVSSGGVHADGADAEQETSGESRENAYLLQSRRLARLAEEEFAAGNYDTSTSFADEAARLAKQSDVYVAITTAKRCLDQAAASGVSARFPREYKEAENWYTQSEKARDSEEWDIAIDAANMVTQLLENPGASGVSPSVPGVLPATYTVRSWSVSKDCFWNIAGQPWAYGNPRQWRTLYNANKSKLADPNNPNRLDPGIVLDIPSIKGEIRQGAWESGMTYEPLR